MLVEQQKHQLTHIASNEEVRSAMNILDIRTII